MATGLLFQSLSRHTQNLSRTLGFLYTKSFSCHSIACPSQEPPSPHLVNDLSRILSDYRNPQHDIESALAPFVSKISSNIVEQVLKRCSNLGFSAHRFFLWAQEIPGFRHSDESYRILVDILGSSRQFPFLWDFLMETRKTGTFIIRREIFWNVFKAYSRADLPGDAIRAFHKMVDFGLGPITDDLDQLLFSLCKRKHMKHAQEFFNRVKDGDFYPTLKTYCILIRGWGEAGEPEIARNLFDEMLERRLEVDLLAWNSILDALCKGGKMDEAYELFRGMKGRRLEPDAYSYSIFIRSSCDANDLHMAFRVLDSMRRYNLLPNVYTYNCIIKLLCKNGKIDEAYELLDEMILKGVTPDTWSYNTILAFHCDHNEVNKSLKLLSRLKHDGYQPDRHTYNMVLKMLIRIGRFDRVEKVWDSMEKRGFYPGVSTYAVMIHGLCKKRGKLEEACKYFETMIDEGLPPYITTCELLRNKLIGSGFAEEVDILAAKMERSTSPMIQEAVNTIRGNRSAVNSRNGSEFSDQSDN